MTDALTGAQSADLHTTPAATTVDLGSTGNDDAELSAIYDQIERDNGAARDEAGKFSSGDGTTENNGDGTTSSERPQEGGEPGGETGDAGSSTAQPVPLPANWRGMDADWAKIPADVQAKIAARDGELHTRMSEQGRQISAFKPVYDAVEQHRDVLEYHRMPDGGPIEPAFAVDFLLNAQRKLDTNPIAGLIEIADRYGVRDHLAAAITGQIPIPQTPQQQSAGLSPADVQRIVQESLSEEAQVRTLNDELSRLSKDKSLYSEIPEQDMVHSIHRARERLGETATKEAVFDLAYDMAVHADPTLRAKAAAAQSAAAAKSQRQTADARRAASINVTSTSTGRARELTEDEQLAQVYDEIKAKG